jgi:hypothetical protein
LFALSGSRSHYAGCVKGQTLTEEEITERYITPEYSAFYPEIQYKQTQEIDKAMEATEHPDIEEHPLRVEAPYGKESQDVLRRSQRERKPRKPYSPSDYPSRFRFKFCVCKTKKSSKMVQCRNKVGCKHGRFFHYEGSKPCVDFDPTISSKTEWMCPSCAEFDLENVSLFYS